MATYKLNKPEPTPRRRWPVTGPLYHTFVGALKDAGVACVGSTILANENYNVRVVK